MCGKVSGQETVNQLNNSRWLKISKQGKQFVHLQEGLFTVVLNTVLHAVHSIYCTKSLSVCKTSFVLLYISLVIESEVYLVGSLQ